MQYNISAQQFVISRHRRNNYHTAICKVISLTRGHSPCPPFRISVCLHATTLSALPPLLACTRISTRPPVRRSTQPLTAIVKIHTSQNKIVPLTLSRRCRARLPLPSASAGAVTVRRCRARLQLPCASADAERRGVRRCRVLACLS